MWHVSHATQKKELPPQGFSAFKIDDQSSPFFPSVIMHQQVEWLTQREQKEVNWVFWVSEGVFQRWIGSDPVFREHRIVTITSGVRCRRQRSFGDISVYDIREMGSDMEHSLIVVLIEGFDLDMKQENGG